MSTRYPLLCVLAIWALLASCSEGQVGAPKNDGDAAPTDSLSQDTAGDTGNQTTHPADTHVGPTDGVDTGSGGCVTGLEQCTTTGHVETCTSGQWAVSEVCDNGCINGACTVGTPGGTCANPLALSIGTPVIGTTDTGSNPNTWLNACTQSYGYAPVGPETIYELNVPQAQMLKFTVTPIDPTYFTLYIRTTCTDPGSQFGNMCDGSPSPGSKFELTTLMPSGKHYVFIDDLGDGTPGEFQLKVEPASLPACGSQIPTIIDLGSGTGTASGDTAFGATSEYWLTQSCTYDATETYGPEVVYAFAVRKSGAVAIAATPTNPAASMLGIYLRTDCNDRYSQPDDACGYTAGNGTATMNPSLTPGAYYLFVDDFASTWEGPDVQTQQFNVSISAP